MPISVVQPETLPEDGQQLAEVDVADRAYLIERYSVSRETVERLDTYAAMLGEWQKRLNLVGPATLPRRWSRHFLDSAQLLDHAPERSGLHWIDLGSGAGFPALVIAVMRPDVRMVVVESRAKKCAFLEAVVEACGLETQVSIRPERIESLPPQDFDVISARALASLAQLFDWGLRFAESATTTWLLPKGASVDQEMAEARKRYDFSASLRPSITDPSGRIVLARNVQRRNRK